ncbi:uncharacterized protein A1O9_11185 [Exophiala aquamarina CBS 119918]|uniref:ATP-dependent DNA helicase II subunit 2 n=1 Tax=Exophiala aquamarina CBS 119918 TaxID=1182545 RepID=A0A072P0L4_9EURO|nr:uncharacterized protein A1O9_11185 [Exophiala aquamarina CBS 119918]KEF52768.1 hypothetical protein A1O9_11185 [Exophiala aquamarina CBS 119918]
MTDKEATVYVIDVAQSMGKTHCGRKQSDLDWALQYVWDKISNTVFTGRKTLQIGVVGLGTDKTANGMQGDEGYDHISELQPITQILMPQLQELPKLLKPSRTDDRDVLSGIIIAVDMIMRHCKHLKYKKKVVVVTNATGQIDDDGIKDTAEQFKNNGIELVVLGIDFDDPDYGVKEENKSPQKARNEQTLKQLVELSEGEFGTMQEAIDSLSRPQIKAVRPTPTYRGRLCLGDPERYDTAVSIDVERYFKTAVRRPPTATAFVMREGDPDEEEEDGLGSVHTRYVYKVKDENSADGTKNVEREELAKGYEYGRTAVAISETEQNITKLETQTNYEILGFLPAENVERYMLLDSANMIVGQKGNDKAALALSSLIHALHELGSVAIARLVKKDMAEPILTVLSPLANAEIECLVENILPFAEDLRSYRFPPLDKILTISGKELTEHRNLPNDDLLNSMSDFVDSLNMVDDDGDEEMAMDDTFSPVLHVIEGAIKYRAVHPDEGLPPKPVAFTAYSKQAEHLQERSKKALAELIKAADVKKVPPKVKGRRRYRDVEKPLSGLNVEDLFRKENRSSISSNNAVPEFKQLLASTTDLDAVKDGVTQMSTIMEDQIKTSFGEKNYARVLEILGTVRDEMVGMEEPELYNNALRQIKKKILAKELGGDRTELWYKIRISKLGLINSDVSAASNVSREEADIFMKSKS